MAPKSKASVGRRTQAAPGSSPAWLTANRVHGHTRLRFVDWQDEEELFLEAAAGFKRLGARTFARHVKTGGEDPPWSAGEPPPPNIVKQFIDHAHGIGTRIIAYYWHMSQESLEGRPGWVCKKFNGRPIPSGRKGDWLDITGPYRKYVRDRLRELGAMGADAVFFDFRHLPPQGCWHTALAQAWVRLTGQPAPDIGDPLYLEFLDFKAGRIEATFAYWREQVLTDYPNMLFFISTTTIPALTDREMTTRLCRHADCAKNEYRHALSSTFTKNVFDSGAIRVPPDHVRQALGWTVLRDASDGRPPHIWAPGVPNRHHAQAYAGSLLTFGCIANMDAHETSLIEDPPQPPHGKTPPDALEAAFALGNAVSPHLKGSQLVRWAAIHFSERIRNDRGSKFSKAWREVLWPLVGAYKVLTAGGVPVGIVTDQQLEEGALDDYQLLVLPNPDELTASQQQAVNAFTRRGGTVIGNDPTWPWSDPTHGAAADAAFSNLVRRHLTVAPVRVIGGPAGRYGVAYRTSTRLVVAVTNDFSWVQIRWTPGTINPAPPAAVGVRIKWRNPHRFPGGLQLRAVEALSGKTLDIEESHRGLQVRLPSFRFMALLVVTSRPGHRGGRKG